MGDLPEWVFIACFSLQKPMTWVFQLVLSSPHPVFAPELLDKLPVWVFLPDYLCKKPRRGLFHPFTLSHTHIMNLTHKKWHIRRNPPNMPFIQPITNIIY